MAYIQLSIIGLPAVVIHGNTLKMSEYSRWYTPSHVMGGWQRKLVHMAEPETAANPTKEPQLELFG